MIVLIIVAIYRSSTVSTEAYVTFQIMTGSHVTVSAGLLKAVDEVIE